MNEIIQRMLRERLLAGELLVSALLSNLLALASSLYVMQVLNRYVSHGVDSTLATLTVGTVLAIALEFGFRKLRHRLAREISAKPNEEISIAVFSVLTRAKAFALQQIPPAKRREIATGINDVEQAYTPANLNAILDVPFSIVFILVLSMFSLTLAIVAVLFIAFVSVFTVLKSEGVRDANQELKSQNAQASSVLDTANREVETIRGFGAAAFLMEEWTGKQDALRTLKDKVASNQGLIQIVTQSSTGLMSVAIIAVGAVMVIQGKMDVGTMIGANIMATRAIQPISRFVGLQTLLEKAEQSLETLKEFVTLPLEPERGSAKRNFQGAIEFRDLAFFYPGSASPLFESLSLQVAPGSLIVVVGESGTGKTTMAKLLINLMDPVRGQIFADGLDLRQVSPAWWRGQVIYFPQEPTFLNATIADNLKAVDPELSNERLNQVIDLAGLRSFIDESRDGFDTMIADNGRQLAVGIRRQLALARALIGDGQVVVIDEMFDGLDSEGRTSINRVVNGFIQDGKTVFLMSHKAMPNDAIDAVIDLNIKPKPKVTRFTDITPSDVVKSRTSQAERDRAQEEAAEAAASQKVKPKQHANDGGRRGRAS